MPTGRDRRIRSPGAAEGAGRAFSRRMREPQNRSTFFLMLNQAVGAATGALFWLLLARAVGLSPAEIGVGYAVIALGTTIGLVAKGGLDTSLLRHVPGASRLEGGRLLRFGCLVGGAAAAVLALIVGFAVWAGAALPDLPALAWFLVGAIAIFLVVTWLLDAYLLAGGDPAATFRRNLVFSGARLLLPFPLVLLAVPAPVPLAWMLALAASTAVGVALARRLPRREGRVVPRREFLHSARRNIIGNAAEFLPGLILVPLVLAVDGAEAAGYFGMAWTAASLLFLAAAAIGRSALSEMVRRGPAGWPAVVRRAVLQASVLLLPGAVGGILLARHVMGLFGADYAVAAAGVFAMLCASTLFIAPAYLHLAVLRAQERPVALVAFPLAMIVAVLALSPILQARLGLSGVALAWMLANAPFGVFAAWRLRAAAKGVIGAAPAPAAVPYE